MAKLCKDFLSEKSLIFMGYSSRNQAFSNSIYKAFTDAGIKVFPINSKKSDKFDVKVYQELSELPNIPSTAYVLLSNGNAKNAVRQLIDNGVKKILFQPGKTADKVLLDECTASGVETAVGCPMMLFGSGIHRLHGFFAGVKR